VPWRHKDGVMEPERTSADDYRGAREARRHQKRTQPAFTSEGRLARQREALREAGLLKKRAERDAMRSSRADERIYIGLHSPAERKRLFLHYFGGAPAPTLDEVTQGPLHTLNERFLENPYEPATWYTPVQLHALGNEPESRQAIAWALGQFDQRYTARQRVGAGAIVSSTSPQLFTLRHASDYFRHVLYQRADLFMKLVPLPSGDDEESLNNQTEVYDEIIAAYFLQELVYGYSQVLSLHFMSVVDWFPVQRGGEFYQVIVSEKLDQSLYDYLDEHRGAAPLRAALFQLFHALETAWVTNYYTHNDAHLGNVMMLRHAAESPLYERDFLYRRLGDDHWWRVSAAAMDGHMLKLIDFGRNRLYVPERADHVEERHGLQRHRHDRLICAPGFEFAGYPCDAANRQIDVLLPLFGLLRMETAYWFGMEPLERAAVYAFCERHLDFSEMDRVVDAYLWSSDEHEHVERRQVDTEFSRVRRRLTAHNLRACPNVCELLRVPGLYVYKFRERGSTASDVLDDAFFAQYRTAQVLPQRELSDDDVLGVRDRHVVVSFLEHPEEAEQLEDLGLAARAGASKKRRPRCAVCKRRRVALSVPKDGGIYLCGEACYEFRYLFGGKTVYRS
jgi:hypothetical protein